MATFGFHTTGFEVEEAFPNQVRDRTFLVTGPSPGGIGAETVLSLAKGKPALLMLAGRSKSKIQPVIDEIGKNFPGTKISFITLDLGSQASVRQAVNDVKQFNVSVDGLINNAAIMACPYGKTTDGIETQFGTNHIGHFLFTNLLLQAGLIAKGARIVNVSSAVSERKGVTTLGLRDAMTYDNGATYDPWLAYATSKMSNVLYTRSLAHKLHARDITAFSLNPGSIATGLQRFITPESVGSLIAWIKETDPDWVMPQQKNLQEGCSTTLRAALDPSLAAHSGAYMDDCQVKEPEVHVPLYPEADTLWALSEKLVGEKFDI